MQIPKWIKGRRGGGDFPYVSVTPYSYIDILMMVTDNNTKAKSAQANWKASLCYDESLRRNCKTKCSPGLNIEHLDFVVL